MRAKNDVQRFIPTSWSRYRSRFLINSIQVVDIIPEWPLSGMTTRTLHHPREYLNAPELKQNHLWQNGVGRGDGYSEGIQDYRCQNGVGFFTLMFFSACAYVEVIKFMVFRPSSESVIQRDTSRIICRKKAALGNGTPGVSAGMLSCKKRTK